MTNEVDRAYNGLEFDSLLGIQLKGKEKTTPSEGSHERRERQGSRTYTHIGAGFSRIDLSQRRNRSIENKDILHFSMVPGNWASPLFSLR